ncbi:CC0125/CC1285 family lipoprotein [Alteromonas oceanisediminis]|uniref:CC0125/CC1285 family lipoprotein n=1 Tax=Alteromonas oceanisediminis TaxID=2836180 RepID=UPI001BDA682E|nr:hypothetical protein [Alteromonas oceanisediminis]MBT0586676.1 hypothetical protein [Alteromonas oceanisediminis]
MTTGISTTFIRSVTVGFILLTMWGCSNQYALQTPSNYVKASSDTSVGYSSVQLTQTTHRVMFTASQVTGPVKVQEYAMQRAAEIAKSAGYSAFTIFDSDAVLEKPQRELHNDVSINRKVPPETQCTMSGCTEVGQSDSMMTPQTYDLNGESGLIHYSMVIRLGDASAFSQADIEYFLVDSVLAGEFGPAVKPRQAKP